MKGRIALRLLAMTTPLTVLTTTPLRGIWALTLPRDIGWKSPWKSGLWAARVCVCVCACMCVSYRDCRVLIYALQGAGVKSDVWLFPWADCQACVYQRDRTFRHRRWRKRTHIVTPSHMHIVIQPWFQNSWTLRKTWIKIRSEKFQTNFISPVPTFWDLGMYT